MTAPPEQIDPLNSPHPVPWGWVMATLDAATGSKTAKTAFYRSSSLNSPDRQFTAYSRIQLQVEPEPHKSRVSSILFVENTQTGSLQAITATSPFAEKPISLNPDDPIDLTGTISLVIPIAWSAQGDRLLAREFESIFGSNIASDFALIWDNRQQRASTVAPSKIEYSNAILLGWSQRYPQRALFRAGMLGDKNWPLWAVDRTADTIAVPNDQPRIFGQVANSLWAGPQGM
jgi:hypothetical protein